MQALFSPGGLIHKSYTVLQRCAQSSCEDRMCLPMLQRVAHTAAALGIHLLILCNWKKAWRLPPIWEAPIVTGSVGVVHHSQELLELAWR